eukprot:TRINITY_DN4644_c0_g1_i1.p1 TRINITY_DN4644_c0_g1~~TRINITY_DN4644_c0_g1_i1.p1  ORF type:complete len:331 (+),score=37.46 TRINITY_DN4644_c0_g1_i1:30-1022(+)
MMDSGERNSWVSGLVVYSILSASVLLLALRNIYLQCCVHADEKSTESERLVSSQRQSGSPRPKNQLNYIQRMFSVVMFLFGLGRVGWCAMRMDAGDSLTSFALNRLCFVSFFSAFCLIVFYLAESLHKRYFGESLTFLPNLGWAFLAVNSILWVISVSLIIVYIVQQSPGGAIQEGNVIYELTIVLVIAVDFLLALAISIFGFRLYYLRSKNRLASSATPPSAEGTRHLIVSILSTLAIAACFLARVVMFAWRPITGQLLDPLVFRVVGYYVAEALPASLQLLLLYSVKEKQTQRSQYIDDLYDNFSDPSVSSSVIGNHQQKLDHDDQRG